MADNLGLNQFENTVEKIIQLKNVRGKNAKKALISNFKDDIDFLILLNLLLNDRVVTGIGKSKINAVKNKESEVTYRPNNLEELINYLIINNTGKEEVVYNIYSFAKFYTDNDTYLETFMEIISKRFKIGIGAKTVNEVIPDFIDTFSVMLAKSWGKEKYKNQLEKQGATITVKLDGIRGVVIKRSDDDIIVKSREGNEFKGLTELLSKYKTLPNGAYDGELICLAHEGEKTEDLFRRTTSVVNSNDEVTDVQHILFEYLTIDEWDNQECNLSYLERLSRLKEIFLTYRVDNLIQLRGHIAKTNDVDDIEELVDKYTDLGYEGIMINLHDKKYKWTRSDSLLKYKLFDSAELLVLDVLEGDMKYTGKVGALKLQWRGENIVEVSSGLTDEERTDYFNNKDLIVGKIVEISYQKESQNKDGGLSVRFPVFKGIRHDKTIKDIRFSDKD